MKRSFIIAAILLSAAVSTIGFADGPVVIPGKPAPAVNDSRTKEAVIAELTSVGAELKDKVGPTSVLLDADKRKELGAIAAPLLKKHLSLMTELASIEPAFGPQVDSDRLLTLAYLALIKDPDTLQGLTETAKGDTTSALNANLSLDAAEWWSFKSDAASQAKVLDKVTELAKAHPTSDTITQIVLIMSSMNPASDDLSTKAKDLITGGTLTGKMATQLKTMQAAQQQADQKLAANVGKPLVLSGVTATGAAFSSADWKGKVILVDFWATWCGPCMAEMPRVKKAYKDFHDKGFEVLGVSNDYAADDLEKFAKENPDAPWPSLFDEAAAKEHNWNPTTLGFGINGIPTMFLIDKKGILRSVTAREDFEKEIPKLLEEK